MIHPRTDDTLTVRSVFVIGADKTVKLMITYPASTGRLGQRQAIYARPSRGHQEASPNFTHAVDGYARLTTGRNFLYYRPGSGKVGSS